MALKRGSFDVQAPLLCTGDVAEPYDDTFSLAHNFMLKVNSEPVQRRFDIETDVDWLAIEVEEGVTYRIETGKLSEHPNMHKCRVDTDEGR